MILSLRGACDEAIQNSELILVNSELNNSTHHSQIKNFCHPEFISGSYQRCISPFNVSCHCEEYAQAGVAGVGFVKTKTSRATLRNRRCEAEQSLIAQAEKRSEAIQNSELILVNSELKNSTHDSQIKNFCHPEFISGSYQRCILPFNENTFLRPNYTLKTGKMLKQVQHDSMGISTHNSQFTTHCSSIGGVK